MIMSKLKAIKPLLKEGQTLLDFDTNVNQETIVLIEETGTRYYNYNDLKNKETTQTQSFDIVYFSTAIPDLFYNIDHDNFQNIIQTACELLKPDGYLILHNSDFGLLKARKSTINTLIHK